MGFDLENRSLPIANINHTCILAGPLNHLRAINRQRLQPFL